MKKSDFVMPTKRKGESKTQVPAKLDPVLIEALRIAARNQTALQGVKISVATLLVSSVLNHNKEVADIYRALKAEK